MISNWNHENICELLHEWTAGFTNRRPLEVSMSLKGVAQETLNILNGGGYMNSNGEFVDISVAQRQAEENTRLYTPDELADLLSKFSDGDGLPQIEVTDEKTQVAAERLVNESRLDHLGILNFASARNPGGGFINGARAQEEDLARCSGLYNCLLRQPEYYEINRKTSSLLYTHNIIYSPGVPWFRKKSRMLLDNYYRASVITAPAPNAGQIHRKEAGAIGQIEETLRLRAGYVLAIARDNGIRNLLLGAWGCGVFLNKPEMVADVFGKWLESPVFGGCFERVTFGVYDPSKRQETYGAFLRRFGGLTGN